MLRPAVDDWTDRLLDLLRDGGGAAYFGEPVTQLEHALQTAALADRCGAPDALVVAALLHDVGHLLHGRGEHVAEVGIDAEHEAVGHRWLSTHFGPAVTEPVRLHVAAKRCLCATDPVYAAALSTASKASLALQGGPMSAGEVEAFLARAWSAEAIALRRWDDAAKVPGLAVPGLGHYAPRIEAVRR
jgi:phosphonate degradation associated HDIG domain protein